MDKKFRISFYPKDASRVKVVTLSRRLAILAACIIVPLSVLGAWLVLSGVLHEPFGENLAAFDAGGVG